MSEWKRTTLKKANIILIDCDHKTPKAQDTGFPYIGIPQLKDGQIKFDLDPRLISEEDYVKWTVKANPQFNDIILSRRCNPGVTAFVPDGVKFALGQNLVLLRSVGTEVTPEYLRWLVQGRDWWGQVMKYLNSGAVFDSLKCKDIPNFEFNLPPLPEQKAISKILGDLDAKIELNRKMNQTLEAMAQTLFQSWFVDFDPVLDNAIAAGNTIPEALKAKAAKRSLVSEYKKLRTVQPELAELFPNRFVYNEELEKWIPKGWEVKNIGDVATVVGGGTPSTKIEEYYCENGISWLSPKDLSGYDWKYIGKGSSDITELGLLKSSAKLMPKGTVLFSSRAPIGYIAIAENEVCTNQGFKSLVPNKGVTTEYLFQFLKSNTKEVESVATGSTFKEVSGNAIKGLLIVVPNEDLLNLFTKRTESSNRKCLILQKQTRTLTQLRDTLLPQLISGKLKVPEALLKVEQVVE